MESFSTARAGLLQKRRYETRCPITDEDAVDTCCQFWRSAGSSKKKASLFLDRRGDYHRDVQDVTCIRWNARETLINGPTAQIAVETASNFPDDKAIRRSIR
ncbi:hypothetical protein F6X42_37425 [Paraburkholderia sp. WC7.3b]|uniref:Uncharacterized protein n=1 Tax=Paraburkholderia podalyriae TaxID=1938811 RepID=A0ABR7Q077_9BURK|nr:hypothetical protein [Paraburkholderia podalyriae]